jgi:hypothetical protein
MVTSQTINLADVRTITVDYLTDRRFAVYYWEETRPFPFINVTHSILRPVYTVGYPMGHGMISHGTEKSHRKSVGLLV